MESDQATGGNHPSGDPPDGRRRSAPTLSCAPARARLPRVGFPLPGQATLEGCTYGINHIVIWPVVTEPGRI